MDQTDTDLTDFDKLVLTEYPYPVAVWYRNALDAATPERRVRAASRLFDFGMRTLVLGLISQYILYHAKHLEDGGKLNALLKSKFPHATLGNWKDMFFTALKAYKGHRDLFFMEQLYDLYWNTSRSTHKKRADIEKPYDTIINIRNKHISEHEFGASTDAQWQVVAQEIMGALQAVLEQFSFLAKYDLVYIKERHPNGEYTYVLYTGEHPTTRTGPLSDAEELKPGLFYLSKKPDNFLRLYPMFIFWESSTMQGAAEFPQSDAAIYSTFTGNVVTYLAAALQENVEQKDPELVGAFLRMLNESIEEAAEDQIEAPELTWDVLRAVADKISDRHFSTVRQKYRQDLYLQRQEVKQAFDDFLASDKVGFLLLGKSGVGKSSFFTSMTDEYRERGDVCLLMYDGGANLDVKNGLSETITSHFKPFLRIVEGDKKRAIENSFREIARIPAMRDQRVIIFIDAINENASARELLRRIDDLVADAPRWLKVVVSSRPEAWRAIKRGSKLAEYLYYSLPGQTEMGVELQPFTFGVEMKNFSRVELPEVYEKYREAYDLKTPYEEITYELRRLLNDPLTLKLVAEVYKGSAIPPVFRPGEIYEKYVAQLIEHKRLRKNDVKLLEEDLVPLMMSEGHYDNKITAEQGNSTVTASGRELLELIHNDDLLTEDRRVNQSFRNLVDAEILVMKGSQTDYEIVFKYERFYDFYGGRRLHQLASKRGVDPYTFFLDMIRMTGKRPLVGTRQEDSGL